MDVLDSFSLSGRIALVTGGSGMYGRQMVEALAEAGAKVFMASRNLQKLEQQACLFRDRGLDVTALSLDQSSETSILNVRDHIAGKAGGIDVLVNNAVERPMSDMHAPFSTFARSMEVNATGIFMMTRIFADHMAQRRRGCIINIASIQGMVGPDFTLYEGLDWSTVPDYFFHKGGMIQLTRFAASYYGKSGVRVNTISPGGFFNNQDERFVKRYNGRTFLGRMASQSDLKGAVVFLASDASAYITGANIPVDGGYTAK